MARNRYSEGLVTMSWKEPATIDERQDRYCSLCGGIIDKMLLAFSVNDRDMIDKILKIKIDYETGVLNNKDYDVTFYLGPLLKNYDPT